MVGRLVCIEVLIIQNVAFRQVRDSNLTKAPSATVQSPLIRVHMYIRQMVVRLVYPITAI